MERSFLVLLAATLLFAVSGDPSQSQEQAPRPAFSRSEEMLERWNDIGNKLIAMAQDFPEDKCPGDIKTQIATL